MHVEIEAKFLNADHDELRAKLKAVGAECVQSMRLMKRRRYDFADDRLDRERNAWVRVRDEGDKITMTYKQLNSRELDGTLEVDLIVDSFDAADDFLEQIGLVAKSFQETRRETWRLDGCEVELDEWPWIRPFAEIEGPDEASVRAVAAKLGFDWTHALHGSVEIAYQAEYDVTERDVDAWSEITFTSAPDWLEAKRRP